MYFVFEKTQSNSSKWDIFLDTFKFYTPALFAIDFLHNSSYFVFGLIINPQSQDQKIALDSFESIQFYETLEAARKDYPEIE